MTYWQELKIRKDNGDKIVLTQENVLQCIEDGVTIKQIRKEFGAEYAKLRLKLLANRIANSFADTQAELVQDSDKHNLQAVTEGELSDLQQEITAEYCATQQNIDSCQSASDVLQSPEAFVKVTFRQSMVSNAKQLKQDIMQSNAVRLARRMFDIGNILSLLFFSLFSIISVYIKWSESPLSYVICGVTALYAIIYIVFVLRRSNYSKQSAKEYKNISIIIHMSLNLLNLILTVLMLINTLQMDNAFASVFTAIVAVSSLLFVGMKIVVTIAKLIIAVVKRKKLLSKRNLQVDADNSGVK